MLWAHRPRPKFDRLQTQHKGSLRARATLVSFSACLDYPFLRYHTLFISPPNLALSLLVFATWYLYTSPTRPVSGFLDEAFRPSRHTFQFCLVSTTSNIRLYLANLASNPSETSAHV